ncbi:MAG TPA: gluconate 2-dehydrogenase subunit 3 family protein [Steroidobacteraceae bacterium]|nr:gluconate 2-dehydrogenase subunit 3 family protein [Steroidobacteraceae bacterium]
MNPTDDQDENSRRTFLRSSGGLLTGVWIAANWPAIAAAAHHADKASAAPAPLELEFLNPAEAADIDAISAQIVPSGATPGAREAHAVHFIDRALATFFSDWSQDFRAGLAHFQSAYRASKPASSSFAQAGPDAQIAYLKTVDGTPFFDAVRTLTLLGMFSSPKYGGNFGGAGWKLMGFVDQHAFTPPFGFYDREYTGFVPYPTEKHS